MIICIGERVHDKRLSDRQVERWEAAWRQDPVGYIRMTPAMTRGSTRSRLLGLTSLRRDLDFSIVNLLPPDNKIGTWNRELAEFSSTHLLAWLSRGCDGRPAWTKLIMLGVRVSRELAHLPVVKYGEVYDVMGTPALCFPHPSGSNRYLNGSDFREMCRNWVRVFLRGTT